MLPRTNEGRWNGRKEVIGWEKIVEREEIAWERACARITRVRECVGMRVAGANRLGRMVERKGDKEEGCARKREREREIERRTDTIGREDLVNNARPPVVVAFQPPLREQPFSASRIPSRRDRQLLL